MTQAYTLYDGHETRAGRDFCRLGAGGQDGVTPWVERPVLAKQGSSQNAQFGLPQSSWHEEGDSNKESMCGVPGGRSPLRV